jgi:hypothetical protein
MVELTKLCLALLLVAAPLANPALGASDPQDMVRSFYGVLLNNMKDGRVLGESGHLARRAPVVAKSFGIPGPQCSRIKEVFKDRSLVRTLCPATGNAPAARHPATAATRPHGTAALRRTTPTDPDTAAR